MSKPNLQLAAICLDGNTARIWAPRLDLTSAETARTPPYRAFSHQALERCLTDLRLSCERRLMRRKGNFHLVPSNEMQRAHMQFFLTRPRSTASTAC
jgi:hypothetical protein